MSEEEQILLPDNYTKLDYIMFNGSQYFNTGVLVNNKLGCKVKYARYEAHSYQDSSGSTILGCRPRTGANNCWSPPSLTYNTGEFSCQFGTNTALKATPTVYGSLAVDYEVEHNFYNCGESYINGDFFVSYDTSQFTEENYNKYPLRLGSFVLNSEVYTPYNFIGKIYYCIITDGDEIIRHYVPCLDDNQNPCFYDLINETTHYSDGEKDFELEKEEEAEDEEIILPDRFIRVEYLQAFGSQYINTNYIPTTEIGFYVDAMTTSGNNPFVMGSGPHNNPSSVTSICLPLHANHNPFFYWNTQYQFVTSLRGKRYIGRTNFLNSGFTELYTDDVYLGKQQLPILNSTHSTQPIFLFGSSNTNGTLTYGYYGKIYEAKISDGNEVVRHFIPAYDKELCEGCMYDVINDVAYYNQGTGKFVYFIENETEIKDLPERYIRVDYLEDTGIQWINTDYVPTPNTGLWVDAQQITHNNGYPIASGENGQKDGFTCPRVLKSTSNTSGFGYGATWHNFGTGFYNARFTSYINLYNNKIGTFEVDNKVTNYVSLGAMNFTPIKTIYIFATNENGGNPPSSRFWKGRIYQAKITEGTELVRHFIPAYDTYRRQYCMYDVVNDKAYYNEGGGDFISNKEFDKPQDTQIGITHNLPKGFKRVNYLIANGGQYIDTNYVPTNETGYYVEGQGYTTSETFYFGLREDTSTDSRIYACATPNVNWGWMTYGTLTNAAANLRQETKFYHNFLNSRVAKATINETDFTYNLPDLDFNPSLSIYLFGYNYAGTPNMSYCLRGRIDAFLISEGEQIVRQFLPCLDDNDVPCMYEIYTGTVHYNQGLGNFSYPHGYDNNPINLPAGYTKCSYLQSNGTQWIDTGYIPNTDTGVSIKLQHLSYGDFIPFGAKERSSYEFFPPRFNTNNKLAGYAYGTTNQQAFYYDKGDDLIYTSTMNLYNDKTLNLISRDTIWRGINYISFGTTFTRSMWLFSYNTGTDGIVDNISKFGGRIFRAKITQDTYLAHDFVPCLDENNRPCMYDLVTQTPFYNQSGGTDFTYCIEHQLPSDFSKLDYLESTGTQIIKTGYVPTDTTGIYVDAYHTKYNGNTNGSVIGLRNTNGNTYFYVGRVQRDTNGAGFGWGTFTSPGGTGNVRYEASLNFLNDRQSIITAPAFAQRINALGTLAFTPTKDLYMFGMNNYDGAATLYSTYRIYRAKISEGSEIVRDWVPAMDNRNSRPCMYDLIDNVAYYNDGEGEFIHNRDFEGTYTGFSGLGCIGNRLSGNAYRLVNALITDGNCRINLGKGIIDSTISHDFRGYTTNASKFMFGTSTSGYDYFWQGNGMLVWGKSICSVSSTDITVVVDAKNNKIRYNDKNINTSANFVSDKQTSIFDVGRTDTEKKLMPAADGSKFYKWVMKKDDKIIHDYRPAIDNNLIPCVLDTITGEAFYNTLEGVLSWE